MSGVIRGSGSGEEMNPPVRTPVATTITDVERRAAEKVVRALGAEDPWENNWYYASRAAETLLGNEEGFALFSRILKEMEGE
jgi:hypothetical protein